MSNILQAFSWVLPWWGGPGPTGGLSSHFVPYLGQSPEGGAGMLPPPKVGWGLIVLLLADANVLSMRPTSQVSAFAPSSGPLNVHFH